MKRLLYLLVFLLITNLSVFSADMRFIQVDGALYSTDNAKKFESLINKINKEKDVSFIVFTGNNIARPREEELKAFIKSAKKLNKPFYVVLGQKDVNRQKKLSKDKYVKILRRHIKSHIRIASPNYKFTKKGVTFIVADGSKEVLQTSNGYYRDNVLEYVEKQLQTTKSKNVVILQHYPLIPPAQKETHYTYKADEYLKMLSNYKNVKAIISGHFGVNNEQLYNGILHIATKNAPTYRIIDILDYDTDNPTFWSIIKE